MLLYIQIEPIHIYTLTVTRALHEAFMVKILKVNSEDNHDQKLGLLKVVSRAEILNTIKRANITFHHCHILM